MKGKILGGALYLIMYVIILGGAWLSLSLFADEIKDYEVIEPEEGVRCVVVSRIMNTSVDCWMVEDE